MGKRKLSIGSIGFLVTVAVILLAFLTVQSGAVNQWFMPNEDAGSFQLKTLRVKEIRVPQASASSDRTLTIYGHTQSGTVTGGTFSGPTISSPTISSPTLTGTVTFRNDTPSVRNWVTNQKLAVWSGSTRYGADSTSIPEGWTKYPYSTTGVTLYGFSDSALIATGATPYGQYGYAMYVQELGSIEGQTCEIAFAAGVSNQPTWYKNFRGKQVQVGALVYTDSGTSGATDFIRPYIITSTNTRTSAGVTGFATYSSDYAGGGWEFLSATTTVPNAATAFEFGFEVKNRNAITGASAFILGPFIVSGVTVTAPPMPIINEEIFLSKQLDPFGSGGSTFGASTTVTSLDLSAANGWKGIVPDDASGIYVTSIVSTAYPNGVQFYGDNSLGGVTIFGVASGTSPQATTAWIPVSSSGTINVLSTADSSGTSLFVHGIRVR